ncbi:MAG: outer membrane beta-barrel protein [Gemmatimonadota bacterium]
MRRFFGFIALVTVLAGFIGPKAHAQDTRIFGMVSVAPAIPVGDFGSDFSTGWEVAAGVGTALRSSPVELRLTASYGYFKESGVGGVSKPLGLSGDALYRFGSPSAKVRPYLLGGLGFYSVKYSLDYSTAYGTGSGSGLSETDNGFSYGAGGGVTVRAGVVSLFAEGRYTAIPSSGHSHVPLRLGVRLGRA